MTEGLFYDLTDYELATTLNEWTGDAQNSWGKFTQHEKRMFRRLQDEACKRFIRQQLDDEIDDN